MLNEYLSHKSEDTTPSRNSWKHESVKKFRIKKSYAISVNLLKNDVQKFANLYREFRDSNPEWFDITKDHFNQEIENEYFVPVVPALSAVFAQLQLIDDFRVSSDSKYLDEAVEEHQKAKTENKSI